MSYTRESSRKRWPALVSEEVSSEENPAHASSSSLRFIIDGDDQTGGVQNGRRKGKTFEELTTEAIREMHKAEKEEGENPKGIA